MQNGDEFFMRQALDEARKAFNKGEVPIGAVVVYGDRIVGRGHNLTETLADPTAHAEMPGADGGDRSDRREIPERMPFVCDRRTVRHVCRGLFLVSGGAGDLWRARSETGGVAAYAFAVPSENAGSHRHSRTRVPRMDGNLLSQVAFLVLSFPNSRK